MIDELRACAVLLQLLIVTEVRFYATNPDIRERTPRDYVAESVETEIRRP